MEKKIDRELNSKGKKQRGNEKEKQEEKERKHKSE